MQDATEPLAHRPKAGTTPGRAALSTASRIAKPPRQTGTGPPLPGGTSARKTTRLDRFRHDRSLVIMLVPGLTLFLLFSYVPLLGNVIAFQDYLPYVGVRDSPFVGTQNFERLFSDGAFWQALRNTLEITALQLVLFFPLPIALALLLHSLAGQWIKQVVQTVLYFPHFISWVIIVALFQQTLGGAGALNQTLREHGWGTVDIMTNPDVFSFLVTTQVIWKDAGWGTIIFLAALSTVDDQLYESAVVDGAGRWRRIWHITLPGIRPVIVLLLILRLGEALNVGFEQILLQRDAVGPEAGEVLDTYVYFHGIASGDWSVAAAAGLFKGLVGLVLIIAANRAAHALGEQGVYQK
ncbi:ABC transporter permease [Streptomyces sp. NPDC056405]|uniref:ABC transporter permease n=1 Tax=Streptomyces sp. NPDC056405 TaxID=3345811 RepID=UPI0035DFCC7B